ncbi:MAG: hypothetical protein HOV82_17145 [Streptomyces sp.]|nr:hypothetical protein [Streptomyces sp.]NUP36182.1 hypothetical protein [Streptomyces sp.]NUS75529.1 hypothetical protein [Streptomyces sp.]
MSAEEASVPQEQADEAGESGGMSERTAKAVLLVIAAGALFGVIAAFPWLAYVIVGVLGTLGWQKARSWRARRRGDDAENEPEDEVEPDVGEALRRLVGDDRGVLLTRLRDDLKVADTKAVKALLDAEGITWKAVRTARGNGPGVHKDDIPAAPSPDAGAVHGGGCCCRSGDNNNSDNSDQEEPEEGLRVVPIGTDGKIIYDPKDTIRHHAVQ